jgi:hypothetical protein
VVFPKLADGAPLSTPLFSELQDHFKGPDINRCSTGPVLEMFQLGKHTNKDTECFRDRGIIKRVGVVEGDTCVKCLNMHVLCFQ